LHIYWFISLISNILPKIIKTVFMKSFLFYLTFSLCSFCGRAQTAEDSVKAAVNLMFEAMNNSDTVLLRASFGDSALLQTFSRNSKGKAVVVTETVSSFAKQVSQFTKGDINEQIVFESIKIDGNMAMVWAPFKLYLKGKFYSCGVNSLQLARLNGVWKVQYVLDTRRTKGCE
jgi:Putative lumazine-binding